MSQKKLKRFYKTVKIIAGPENYEVRLDDKSIKTPEKAVLSVPTEALATMIAGEWDAQGEEVSPETMPMTRLSCTAVDKVAPSRDLIIEQLVRYGGSDLLCYRAENPEKLVHRQEEVWQPILDWLEQEYGIGFRVTSGIVPVSQPEETLSRLKQVVGEFSDFHLSGFGEITQLAGSVSIGLACMMGKLSASEGFEASQLDEDWQSENWGQDKEAVDRRTNLKKDFVSAVQFTRLLA